MRKERWEKIAKEAAKQCGRVELPSISRICKFADAFDEIEAVELGLIPCLTEGTKPIERVIRGFSKGAIAVMVGPEGDFTPDEIRVAERAGFKPVSLGARVLRCDTAAIVILAILNYECACSSVG